MPSPAPTANDAEVKAKAEAPRNATADFIAHVRRLCQNKAARADLRSGLGRDYEQCHRLHRHLVRYLPVGLPYRVRRARYAVAALIAATPADARTTVADGPEPGTERAEMPPNLGASLARAVGRGALKPASAEATLHLLTRQRYRSVTRRLPALTGMILRSRTPIDWPRLTDDLASWDRYRDEIATRWLEHYYRFAPHDGDPTPTGPEPSDR